MNAPISKLAIYIAIANIILSLGVMVWHGTTIQKSRETHLKIITVMDEKNVTRSSAIKILEENGEELFLDPDVHAYIGFLISILAIALIGIFLRSGRFYVGILGSAAGVFSTVIGGVLLFYVLFSGKYELERSGLPYKPSDNWGKYLNKRSKSS